MWRGVGDARLMNGGRVPQEVGRENARLLRKEVPVLLR